MTATAAATRAPPAAGPRMAGPMIPVLLAWIGIVIALLGTFIDMWHVWGASGTFAHGYLIFPISAYLLWLRRARWISLPLQPSLIGVLLVVLGALVWFAGTLLSLNVLMQFAAVGLLIASVLAIAGPVVVRATAFPLLFLLFAVPAGEELVPWLMDFTAHFTVGALDAIGIPVYAEGRLISIPTGNFSVEKACSGIRYLIASVVLGTLFAHLYYRSTWRRLLFVALCAVVPVLANGLRAFLIVILAHFSGNRIAVGVDHLIYGWFFFGLVMLLTFWIGSRFAEPVQAQAPLDVAPATGEGASRTPWLALAGLLLVVFAASFVARGFVARAEAGEAGSDTARVPAPQTGWTGPITVSPDWQPRFVAPTKTVSATYLHGVEPLDVVVYLYDREQAGAELINSENHLFDQERWTWLGEKSFQLDVGQGVQIPVLEVRLRDGLIQRTVWRTFVVGREPVAGGMQAKWQRARSLMSGGSGAGRALLVSAARSGPDAAPERAMHQFLVNYYTPLLGCLGDDVGSSGACVPAP